MTDDELIEAVAALTESERAHLIDDSVDEALADRIKLTELIIEIERRAESRQP
ncbi:hypothetical protein JGU71_29175 [Antrihabitans sp. YC3-6]|uniref:Uncharacterized protein n=1 Tax=Antrihabitans stalagmiti TaxID=2799499 RepID=A0A934NX12_9NOCA|nr:hypothetical protein [Antrihabitans stalagmiti]MBJ8342966.1 hypothetical protein [Antrihabitans stalagmiti]